MALLLTPAIIGCNSEQIQALSQNIGMVSDEIAELEAEIVGDKIRLEKLPLTDFERADTEVRIEENEMVLKQKQAEKGRFVKDKENAEAQDNDLFSELAAVATDLTPLGYGGVTLAFLSLVRGFLRRQAYTSVIKSVQPLIDNAPPEQKRAIDDAQTPGAKKLVDQVQGKKKALPL